MSISRRTALGRLASIAAGLPVAAATVLGAAARTTPPSANAPSSSVPTAPTAAGRIRHSVCRWPYGSIPFETFCARVADLGIESVELVGPDQWPILRRHGLHCAMPNGADRFGLTRGFNDRALHDQLVEDYSRTIPLVAEAGYDTLICFSGNRNGLDDETGLDNCAQGLTRLMPLAEDHGVTLVMELLNSRVDHPDYQCDRTAWGAALVDRVGSDRFRLLYDIYHMQIMEGDVIRTIRTYSDYIAHYHTGGNPGRNEIDETQELQYPAIMQAIEQTGYTGFVAQEFIPTWDDPFEALQDAVSRCTVPRA